MDAGESEDIEVTAQLDQFSLPRLGTHERFIIQEAERRAREISLIEAKERNERFPFQPVVHNYANLHRQSIIEREREYAQRQLEREAKKKAEADRYVETFCTFKPRIAPQSKAQAESMFQRAANESVADRLIHYGKVRDAALEERRSTKQKEESLMLHTAFVPKTNRQYGARTSNHSSDSLHTRSVKLRQAAAKSILEAQLESDRAYTFRPTINKVSATTVGQRESDPNRLYLEGMMQKERMQEKIAEEKTAAAAQHTFHPVTNRASEELLISSNKMANAEFYSLDFVKRQEKYQRLKQRQMDELRIEVHEKETAPEVARHVDQNELEQRFDELYDKTQRVSHEAKEEMRKQLQAEQCPFKPQLSSGTKRVVRQRGISQTMSVVERLYRFGKSSPLTGGHGPAHCKGSTPVKDVPPRCRTPQPKSNAADFFAKQILEQQERQYNLEAARAALSLSEELQCPFRPKVNPSPRRPVSAPRNRNISGYDDFLKRQKDAETRKEDLRRRAEDVGKGKPCNGPNYTVVVPFNLQTMRPRGSADGSAAAARSDGGTRLHDDHIPRAAATALAAGTSFEANRAIDAMRRHIAVAGNPFHGRVRL